MATMTVVFDWDEGLLGKGWMNVDNLGILLYTNMSTKSDLLRYRTYDGDLVADINAGLIKTFGDCPLCNGHVYEVKKVIKVKHKNTCILGETNG